MSRFLAFVMLAGICAAGSAGAHEFWLQPSAFSLAPREPLSVTLQVGDHHSRQRSSIPAHRITRFTAVGPTGEVADLRDSLRRDSENSAVRPDAPGVYVLALETDYAAHSRLSASRFNEYIKNEGLTPALEHRERHHEMHADGFERYGRRAKSMVLVGSPGASAQAHVTRPLGLRLEIVPLIDPYVARETADVPFRVIYEGRPLAGALMKLRNLEHDAGPVVERRSDREGVATFSMPGSGTWLLSVVWTQRLANAPDADFETTFSSLTFGLATRAQETSR